jgi:elongator complex protein 1
MQNLCLSNTRTVSIADLTGANVVRRFAIDADKQTLYLLTSHSIYSLSLENEALKSIYSSTDQTITIEDLCFLSELNHLSLGLSNGDLLSLQFDNDFEENVNTIGTLEECIHELKSSPDQQILVAVTNTKVLLLSTNNDYEPIAETLLDTNDFGEQQFVNVGWGSKTTQFHGSLGKKAAVETVNSTPIKTRSDIDDARSRIIWRDDGDLFGISFISLTNQWRTIKIFNKQGQLQATNESVLNGSIESAIAWKISGELIGAAMRFNNGQKLTISFLEKNGLKHGELVLETTGNGKQYVEHLAWNKDSTILAIVLRQENNSYLQLWSSSNYHWYLKQSFPFLSTNIQALLWDIDINNKLHLITDNGQYYSMNWSWTSQISYTNTRSLVFLIDGCHLFVSDFTHSSIPPPMSSYEIITPLPILAITVDDDHDQLILILSDRSIAICGSSPGLSDYRTIIHLSEMKSTHYVTSVISSSESPIKTIHNSTHFRLINQELYFIEDSHLHIYNLQNKTKNSLLLNFNCLTTAIDNEEVKHLYLQDEHGKIFRLDKNEFHARMHFPRPCPHFSVVPNGQFLGLTENYRLYLNTNELAHNCNSYFIHDKTILVYSTLQHQLIFRSLINDQSVTEINSRRTGKLI